MPMLTGTLITAAGFLPIGWRKSVTGEYTFAIFAVTTAALLISWVVSVYFVPYLGAGCCAPPASSRSTGRRTSCSTRRSTAAFRRMVNWCVRHRWITIGADAALFALGIVGMGKVQQQFFPDSSRPEILVDLWLPEGSTARRRGAGAALRGPHDARARRAERDVLGRRRRAALLPAAGPDLSAEPTSARPSCCPRTWPTREAMRRSCRPCWPRSSRKCAAA
jgi:hypothetical protein